MASKAVDHLEAVIEGRNDRKIIVVAMRQVARIVDKYGGFCVECGLSGLITFRSIGYLGFT